MRQMTMVGFLQAQNCTNLAMSWRHPDSRTDFMSADFYQEIGRTLERGKFHLGFFDDRLALPDRYGGDHAHAIEHGIRVVKLDPVACLMAMGMATTHLGLGATCSTTYYEPFHIARQFATVDHLTGGRAAWNVVTSLNEGEAWNMGRNESWSTTAATTAPTSSWRWCSATGRHGMPMRWWWTSRAACSPTPKRSIGWITRRALPSRGPFTVPRTPQGHPVIIQAGQSGRGRRFAGRWAEADLRRRRAARRCRAGLHGGQGGDRRGRAQPRPGSPLHPGPPVCAATKAEAEDRMA